MSTPRMGVYALFHPASRCVYVGSSKNLSERRGTWWHALNTRSPQLSFRMQELTTSRHDWEFRVLWEGVCPLDELLTREREAVEYLRRCAPEKCLNVTSPTRLDVHSVTAGGRTMSIRAWQAELGVPKSTIAHRLRRGLTPEQAVGIDPPPPVDYAGAQRLEAIRSAAVLVIDDGEVISRREAAERIGCTIHTLTERLRQFRASEGQARVQLSDLIARSEKYRRRQ